MSDGWIELREHEEARVPREVLSGEAGAELWSRYAVDPAWLAVDFPSPKTDGAWSVGASSVVGAFPLPGGGGVRVRPKVPLRNLFRMLEVAHGLELRALPGEVEVASIEDLFGRLAARLARRTLGRVRRGLVKEYRRERDALPYVRGRIDVAREARRAVRSRIDCRYQEHTTDQHDNRVLLWTLHRLARSPLLADGPRREVRTAVRALAPAARLVPVDAADAVRASYDRLRADYRPMHLLCRFFLLNAGPTHRAGDRAVTPFVVAMPRLFELFVAESLRAVLPSDLRLDAQETLSLDRHGGVRFQVDLVVRDRASRRPLLALDTKYKTHATPAADDVQQAIAYAAALGCPTAALVYPQASDYDRARAGGIEVHRLALPLDGPLAPAVERLGDRIVELAREARRGIEAPVRATA